MRTYLCIVALLMATNQICRATETNAILTSDHVTSLIRSGSLGQDFAERAQKTDDLHVSEIPHPNIPFQIFTFSDYQAGYSILVEDGQLVLLCAGFGGGYARDFRLTDQGDKRILTYKFDVGSGISRERTGVYVLDTGKAKWTTFVD